MSDSFSTTREILVELLRSGPQKGARLRQLLTREFERRTSSDFDRYLAAYPKFSAFLAANADLVEITRPQGSGDVSVHLRSQPQAGPLPTPQATPPASPSPTGVLFVPRDVWQAFTNPDPRRRRFFHRFTRQMVHYLEGSTAEPNVRLARQVADDHDFVEIVPPTAADQSAWMRDFVKSVSLPDTTRAVADHFLVLPYSSAVNAAFTAALGQYAESWKQVRASKVHHLVVEWAKQHGIPAEHVAMPAALGEDQVEVRHAPAADAAARAMLRQVVDALLPNEISHVLVPASVILRIASKRQ